MTRRPSKNHLRKLLFIALFFILGSVVVYLIHLFNEAKLNERLDNATLMYTRAYHTAYSEQKQVSQLIQSGLLRLGKVPQRLSSLKGADEKEKKAVRDAVYQALSKRYKDLKELGIYQLQLHLPNNESFLRMHQPDHYGDDLSQIRASVAYVNKNHKPIDVFEEGRVGYGLRFVYPIFHQDKHVGSMEIGLAASTITASIMRQYYVLSNYFAKQSVADRYNFEGLKNNYIPSHHPGYYYDKLVLQELKKVARKDMKELKPNQQTADRLRQMGMQDEPSSYYDKDINMVFTIIPTINTLTQENIGYLSIRSQANYPQEYVNLLYVLSLTLLAIGLFLFYTLLRQKEELEVQVQQKTEENLKQRELLQQQNKLAAMGEMIGAIAHQWRQPLSSLSGAIQNLEFDYEDGLMDKKFLDNFIQRQKKTIHFMSKTIDDFRSFFRVDKQKRNFDVQTLIKSVIEMLSAQLEHHQISVELHGESFSCAGYPSEFQQVILNLINNAKDALIENHIANPKIVITLKDGQIQFQDNAGGIPEDVISRVFEPYFTTKEEGKGTGMGLYMSKIIIEDNMGGHLTVENDSEGAIFTIVIKEER